MRGHIVKRYKDSYTIVLTLGRDPVSKKLKQQWVSVKGNKKNAEKRLAELLHQLDTGTFVKPGKTTLAEFLGRWLEDYAWAYLAPRTAEGYEYIVDRHIIPALGNITLTQLKPEHIQRYYTKKLTDGRIDGKGGLSPKTVRHHHATLHAALKIAVQWGVLIRNPVDAVNPPRFQRPQINTMTEDDIHTFLEAAKATSYYSLFYLAIYTGMRRSELLALRWCDVDLLLCQISVTRTLHRLRDGRMVFRQPKTAKGRRLITLPPSAALVLKEHKDERMAERLLLGVLVSDDNLVFSQVEGSPLVPDSVTHMWIKLAKRTGLKGIRLHDARHTHASLLLKAGTHPKVVQERLGHAGIQITLDTYSHITPGLQEAAAVRFDDLVSPKLEKAVVEKID